MKKRFEVLDSFRGIAALMLAIYHLHVLGIVTELNLVRNAYLLVDFFFVLSGFVISYSYLNKITNTDELKLFMQKRITRLWSLHMFMTLMFIPFAFANMVFNIDVGDRFSLYSFVTNTFLVQALNLSDGATWNIPAWSISVEFYTYLIFAILCLTTPLRKNILIAMDGYIYFVTPAYF